MCILTYDDVTLPGGYWHPVGLIEARNQSWKPQSPVGLFRVHWVSCGCDPCKQINGIRNQLNHMHTYPCRDGTNQLILLQGEIGIAVAGQNIAK